MPVKVLSIGARSGAVAAAIVSVAVDTLTAAAINLELGIPAVDVTSAWDGAVVNTNVSFATRIDVMVDTLIDILRGAKICVVSGLVLAC